MEVWTLKPCTFGALPILQPANHQQIVNKAGSHHLPELSCRVILLQTAHDSQGRVVAMWTMDTSNAVQHQYLIGG